MLNLSFVVNLTARVCVCVCVCVFIIWLMASAPLSTPHTPFYRYVGYAMKLAYMMRGHGAIPVLIFDGQSLPLKAAITGAASEITATAQRFIINVLLENTDGVGAPSPSVFSR